MVHLWGKFKERIINELSSQAWSKHRESIVIAKPQVSYRSSFLPDPGALIPPPLDPLTPSTP